MDASPGPLLDMLKSTSALDAHLLELADLDEALVAACRALFEACDAALYPCDAFAVATVNRALSLSHGFSVLMRNDGYMAAAGILRMQLDNSLRFNGIRTSPDPHGTANRVFNGTPLKDLKNSAGEKMSDAVLRKSINASHPWVNGIYKLSSGYIHLSEQHVLHLLQRSPPNANGQRDLNFGSLDESLTSSQQEELVRTFNAVTRLVIDYLEAWTRERDSVCDRDELCRRYPHSA